MRIYEQNTMWANLRTICPRCHRDFAYCSKDVREHVEYNFETRQGIAYKYTNCPKCGTECIFTDPFNKRVYNDDLVGLPTKIDDSPDFVFPSSIIYDGGDEDAID